MVKVSIQIVFKLLLAVLQFFNIFVLRTFNLTLVFVSVLGYIIALLLTQKYKKPVKRRDNTIYYVIIGGCLIYQIILYILGYFTGFSTSYNVFYKNYISKVHILAVFAIAIMTEFARYLSVSNLNHDRKDFRYYLAKYLMLANYIMIDYAILGKQCDFTSKYEIFNLLITFIIPTITKNLFLDYNAARTGFIVNIVYRLIIDLYIFFISIIPDINIFISTVSLSLLPYLLYLVESSLIDKPKKQARKTKNKTSGASILSIAFLIVLVYLVSCQFTYAMIAIGSGSMQGTVDKGDAVIYKAYKKEKLNVDDIIVFHQDNRILVHRITDIIDTDNGGQAYFTKGDANLNKDSWIVTENNIVGVVKLRVMLVAWPSVLLNEWL